MQLDFKKKNLAIRKRLTLYRPNYSPIKTRLFHKFFSFFTLSRDWKKIYDRAFYTGDRINDDNFYTLSLNWNNWSINRYLLARYTFLFSPFDVFILADNFMYGRRDRRRRDERARLPRTISSTLSPSSSDPRSWRFRVVSFLFSQSL